MIRRWSRVIRWREKGVVVGTGAEQVSGGVVGDQVGGEVVRERER